MSAVDEFRCAVRNYSVNFGLGAEAIVNFGNCDCRWRVTVHGGLGGEAIFGVGALDGRQGYGTVRSVKDGCVFGSLDVGDGFDSVDLGSTAACRVFRDHDKARMGSRAWVTIGTPRSQVALIVAVKENLLVNDELDKMKWLCSRTVGKNMDNRSNDPEEVELHCVE